VCKCFACSKGKILLGKASHRGSKGEVIHSGGKRGGEGGLVKLSTGDDSLGCKRHSETKDFEDQKMTLPGASYWGVGGGACGGPAPKKTRRTNNKSMSIVHTKKSSKTSFSSTNMTKNIVWGAKRTRGIGKKIEDPYIFILCAKQNTMQLHIEATSKKTVYIIGLGTGISLFYKGIEDSWGGTKTKGEEFKRKLGSRLTGGLAS